MLNLNISLTSLPFGTSLIFELRKDENDLHYINLMLKNNNITEPVGLNPVKMNECDQLCNFGNFFDILIRRTMSDITKECSSDDYDPNMTTDSIFNTNFYSTPCPTVDDINMTDTNQGLIKEKESTIMELNRMELSLIIAVAVLSLIVTALLISFGLYAYKKKVFKVSF